MSPQSHREHKALSIDTKENANALSHELIGSAIEVHKILGPGLLESAYEACLCHELKLRSIPFERQVELPIEYKGLKLSAGYRMDIVVDGKLVLELKSVEKLMPIHEAQMLTYLRLSKIWLGLLINFNVPILKQGIKRLVQG
ncbi:MAG: GxxExxY protein [Anaerolineales bacterium]|nr:GxxExxY protein [Anaerolineales bacterium]